jgi:hypothetical protein
VPKRSYSQLAVSFERKETASWHKKNQTFRNGSKGPKIKRSKVKIGFKEENQKEGKEIQ